MKKRIIAVWFILCILLSACGATSSKNEEALGTQTMQETQGTKNTDSGEQPETVWSAKKIELPDPDASLEADVIPEGCYIVNENWKLIKETIYRFFCVKSSSDRFDYSGIYVQMLRAPYTEWENYSISLEDWVEGETCRPWIWDRSQYFSDDGSIYVLLQGENSNYVGRWSVEDGCSAVKIESDWLTESFFDDKLFLTWGFGEKTGNYFLYNEYDTMNGQITQLGDYQTVWLDAEYQKKEGLPDTEDGVVWDIVQNPYSDKLYLCGLSSDAITVENGNLTFWSKGFTIWTENQKEPIFTTQDTGMLQDDSILFYSEPEGYLWNLNGIWQFSTEDQSINLIFDSCINIDYQQDMAGRCGICLREDGSLLMLSAEAWKEDRKSSHFLWEMTGKTFEARQTLELATTIPGTTLEQAIVDFNNQSDKYAIELRIPEEGESFDDFRTKIQADLAAGGGPDLFVTGAAIDLDAGARKQYLLDLSDYFAEYEASILPSAWKTGEIDGKLYAVPYGCQITTLAVSKDVVGERTGWTLQEAMECMEKSDAVSFSNRENQAQLFFHLGLSAQGSTGLVDWEQRISYLNSDEAIKLLDFSIKYADNESTLENQCQRVADGEVLTYVLYLYNPFEIQTASAIFKDKEVYIGFPTEDEGSGSLILGDTIAINQACPSVDGAVEFLKYLLSEEVQVRTTENLAYTSFPVTKDALEQFFVSLKKDYKVPEELSHYGDFEFQEIPFSDEKINALRELFMTARPVNDESSKLMNIIEEELSNYISGNKSAKDVMDIVQNRAQLYLDENQ